MWGLLEVDSLDGLAHRSQDLVDCFFLADFYRGTSIASTKSYNYFWWLGHQSFPVLSFTNVSPEPLSFWSHQIQQKLRIIQVQDDAGLALDFTSFVYQPWLHHSTEAFRDTIYFHSVGQLESSNSCQLYQPFNEKAVLLISFSGLSQGYHSCLYMRLGLHFFQ